jgi:Spy/CpxP family protein refolding chaperone
MKLPLLAFLTFLPCLALAQPAPPDADQASGPGAEHGQHHPEGPDRQLARLTEKLNLTDAQQAQIKPILVSRDQQLKAIFDNTSLTAEAKHDQAKKVFEGTDQKIESFLTSEQDGIFTALRQHRDRPLAH